MPKRTVYLIRHAKSSWKEAGQNDRERPLNKRGHRNAVEMSQKLAAKRTQIELLISSPAKRAQTTAQYFASELDYPAFDISLDDRVYFSGTKGLLNTLKDIEDDISNVMIIGHNPDITDLLRFLCADSELALMPTCTIAKLRFELHSWRDMKEGSAVIKYVKSPKKNDMAA